MKRTELEAMALTKEQVDEIMRINGDDIENARSSYASEVTTLKAEITALTQNVKERDTQIEGLKKSAGDNAELQKQIEALQADNKAKEEAHAKELARLKVDAAVDKALTDGGAKNLKAARALLDLTDAKLSEDGTVKGLAEQIQKLQTGEDSKFLFAERQQDMDKPQFRGFQPGASTTVPDSKQAGYEARLAEARKKNDQLEVIRIKREAFEDGGRVLM